MKSKQERELKAYLANISRDFRELLGEAKRKKQTARMKACGYHLKLLADTTKTMLDVFTTEQDDEIIQMSADIQLISNRYDPLVEFWTNQVTGK